MLRSMTGYGRAEESDRVYGRFFVEIQGINRKYFDLSINLPKNLLMLETKIRDVVLRDVSRGRVNIFIGQEKRDQLIINKPLIKKYYKAIKEIKNELKMKGDVDINLLAGLKEFITVTESGTGSSNVWKIVERCLKDALKKFQAMREKEGKMILRHIDKSLEDIETHIEGIEVIVPGLEKSFMDRLLAKIREIGLSTGDTDERVRKEVAIIAERCDVTEEINRMKSHIIQFRNLADRNEPIGKTMDFLIQEMMREINTLGNKTGHAEISKHVIFVKSELEKIREQVQNVE